jgi:hypothetical protein
MAGMAAFTQMEGATHIHRHELVPQRRIDLLDRNRRDVRADGGVVDQDIEPAELLLGLGDHGSHRCLIAHVGQNGVRRSAFGRDRGGDRSAVFGVGQHDLGAFSRQRLGEDRAERGLRARGRAGDDRNLSVQAGHWNFSFRVEWVEQSETHQGR